MLTDPYHTLNTDRLRTELAYAREDLEFTCHLLSSLQEKKRRLTQGILGLSAELENRGELAHAERAETARLPGPVTLPHAVRDGPPRPR